jgi:hypothetical protein
MADSLIPTQETASDESASEQSHGDGHGADADRQHDQQHQQAAKTDVPSEEDCLRAIVHVGRLAALGVFKPSVANSVRNSFRDVLQHHQKKAKAAEKNLTNDTVIECLRQDPKVLSLLEPLLSQEQIELIVKNT